MNTEDFKATLKAIDVRFFKYNFEIADEYKKISTENEITAEQSEQLETEFIAFRFMTRNENRRFRPVAEYTDGTVFPDEKKEVTQDRLDYWLKRAGETKNPVMQARYYDLNYEFNSKIDKKELARKMISSYISASKAAGEGNEMDVIDSVTRAFLVALKHKSEFADEFVVARDNVIDTINSFTSTNLRWCLELIDIVVEYHGEFTEEQIKDIKELTDSGVAHYHAEKGSFMILESYLKVNREMTKIATPSEYDADAATQADAQLYIDEADNRGDSLFIQQIHLLKAEKILRDGGLNADANKVHRRLEEIAKDPSFSSGFQEFTFEQQIPQEELDNIKSSFSKATDKGQLLAYARPFMPSWKDSKKSGNLEKYGSISDIFTSIVINDDNMPIAKEPDNPSVRKTMRYYDASILVSEVVVTHTLKSAIEDGSFTLEDIAPQLEKIKTVNPDTYKSVTLGFKYLFEGKYYEAVSILLPQMEDLMADVMVSMGINRYRQRDIDLVEYKTLGPILSALKKVYGDDVYHFLHYKLIDEGKDNLRNFNGHGKLKVNTPHLEQKAYSVLQAYMCVLAPIIPTPTKI